MTYAGLTTADKGALESYLSKGIDRCPLMLNGELQIVDAHEALAQIAEMELTTSSTPLTWNERINQMTVEEKAKWLYDLDVCRVSSISIDECNSYRHCTECMRNMLNSPYTEGATK